MPLIIAFNSELILFVHSSSDWLLWVRNYEMGTHKELARKDTTHTPHKTIGQLPVGLLSWICYHIAIHADIRHADRSPIDPVISM